ncbi:hypothetical protein DENSPDRAFT_886764 [Dentipellis sp. KUC8613]|nr:hypothetical protein DENSPDRAFT_886764 [Dentipellis sp. KUC8613]
MPPLRALPSRPAHDVLPPTAALSALSHPQPPHMPVPPSFAPSISVREVSRSHMHPLHPLAPHKCPDVPAHHHPTSTHAATTSPWKRRGNQQEETVNGGAEPLQQLQPHIIAPVPQPRTVVAPMRPCAAGSLFAMSHHRTRTPHPTRLTPALVVPSSLCCLRGVMPTHPRAVLLHWDTLVVSSPRCIVTSSHCHLVASVSPSSHCRARAPAHPLRASSR